MAEPGLKKGTVTALGSVFPAEEAEKASKRVHDAIADRRKELDRLNTFAADNSALTKIVRQLPDEISHEIMVPFGSAAFFPGRLIHTNEFLVLLGDAYYAERTSKQTVDILKRRQKSLESQMDALKASLLDLETEAKFFDSTAAEAKEGIVEIREEYNDEPQSQQEDVVEIREEYTEEPQNESKSGAEPKFIGTHVLPIKEDEHARMMEKIDELEKEELEAGSASGSDQDDDPETEIETASASGTDENEDSEAEIDNHSASGTDEDEDSEAGSSVSASRGNGGTLQKIKSVETEEKSRGPQPTGKASGRCSHQDLVNRPSIVNSNSQLLVTDGPYKQPLPPDPKGRLQNSSDLKLKDSADNIGETDNRGFGGRKAFTGSVVEHAHGLPSSEPPKSSSLSQPSKPVSRFKMMKGNR